MHWITRYSDLRLDIVGLIAVLGEGSVTRNAQALSLSWWSVIPRLLPAPQALLEHDRKNRLDTKPGTVVGAYSGTVKKEINFFAHLLHGGPPEDFHVELIEVKPLEVKEGNKKTPRSFAIPPFGILTLLSITGAVMSAALFGLSIHYNDGFGLLSVVMLSGVSSIVGFASHWTISFREPPPSTFKGRPEAIPRSDLVIYYPNGGMRVIRTEERIARLYFQAEHCKYFVGDNPYRALALFATIMLMAGVVSLANATIKIQIAFAAAYVILNALYWTTSALEPRHHHWVHGYHTRTLHYVRPHRYTLSKYPTASSIQSTMFSLKTRLNNRLRAWWASQREKHFGGHISTSEPVPGSKPNFTEALWVSIFLTGTSQWLNEATHIAPINTAWNNWLREAEKQAQLAGSDASEETAGFYEMHQIQASRRIFTNMDKEQRKLSKKATAEPRILLPSWGYQNELTRFLKEQTPKTQKRLQSELPGATVSKTEIRSQTSERGQGTGLQAAEVV